MYPIEELKSLLKYYNIQCIKEVGVREFYKNGKSIGISSNKSWNTIVNDQDFISAMGLHYFMELFKVMHENVNYFIRTRDHAKNVFQQRLTQMDLCNSVVIYKKEKQLIRGYYFISHPFDNDALTFFVNNFNLFNTVINNTKNKIDLLGFFSPQKPIQIFSCEQKNQIFCKRNNICNTQHTYMIDNNKYQFTEKEIQVLALLNNHCTIKEISYKMKISPRTVEWHLGNIKSKLSVFSKSQVIEFSRKLNVSYKGAYYV